MTRYEEQQNLRLINKWAVLDQHYADKNLEF